MTTKREMELSYAEQEAIIAALLAIDQPDLAARLDRCMKANRSDARRPFSCQSAACVWCRPKMINGWWTGMCDWAGATSSLAVLSISSSGSLPDAARHLRRALRDVRDRVARQRTSWREVRFAGLLGGDRMAMVLVSHEGINRSEVQNVLHRRWPDLLVKKLGKDEPTSSMSPADSAELGRCRRGIEPLRIVVMPQQEREAASSSLVGSVPVLVG